MSALELKEFAEIVDADEARRKRDQTTEADLQRALQALLMHQCVYADRPMGGRPYTIIARHRDFFEKYVNALDYQLIVEQRDGLAAVRPRTAAYGWKETRFKKDETLVLLVLRYLFEDGTRRGEMDETGRIETNTDEIYDAYKTLAGEEPPSESRLHEILAMARRRGLVRVADADRAERITPLTVLPGIRVLIPDTYVEAVIDWVENGAEGEDSVFDRLSTRLAGDAASGGESTGESGGPGAPPAAAPGDDAEPEPDDAGDSGEAG